MSLIQIASFLYHVCIITGFLYQTISLSVLYFSYDVTTALRLVVPQEVNPFDMSACFRYVEVFYYENFNSDFGTNLKRDNVNLTNVFHIQDQLSLQQIFEYTPRAFEVIDECFVRKAGFYSYERAYGENCTDYIAVNKFFLQEFVCYRFHARQSQRHLFRNPAYAITNPYTVFMVTLNQNNFRYADAIKAIVHKHGTYPRRSAAYAPVTWRNYNATSDDAVFNWFDLSYYNVVHRRLPYPYKTNCKTSHTIDQKLYNKSSDCEDDCLFTNTAARLNRVPFRTVINSTSDYVAYKPLSPIDLNTVPNYSAIVSAIEDNCTERCRYADCESRYSVTITSSSPNWDNSIVFGVNVQTAPSFYITYVPMMQLISLLVYLFSLSSVYFGFAFFVLNPVAVKNRLRYQVRNRLARKRRKTLRDYVTINKACCLETRRQLMSEMIKLKRQLHQQVNFELSGLNYNLMLINDSIHCRRLVVKLRDQLDQIL